jgi:hypothetical protein
VKLQRGRGSHKKWSGKEVLPRDMLSMLCNLR